MAPLVLPLPCACTGVCPTCDAARLLLTGHFDHEADPSGYTAYTAARSFRPLPNKKRISNTPEAAESVTASSFVGESVDAATHTWPGVLHSCTHGCRPVTAQTAHSTAVQKT
jgi:hypothetical protein